MYPTLKKDSLAFSLLWAAQAVALVRAGNALPQALTQVFVESAADAPARGAIQDLAYRTLRCLGHTECLLTQLVNKTPAPPLLYGLLCTALGLLLETKHPAYPTFTVVNQAVAATASDEKIAHAKAMVNAVLRRFLRERAILAVKTPSGLWNYPTWWIDRMQTAYPTQWQAILRAANTPPPLTLRVNQRKNSLSDYLARLTQHNIVARQIGPSALCLQTALPVSRIPGFDTGLVSVQDAAAQLAAPLLELSDGMRVLDACAAPGGKTSHILELAKVELTALDNNPTRLARITENLQRLQLSANLQLGDASKQDWWDGVGFDRILADVPCTASGVVRRHPDIRWLRRKTDTEQLATLSGKILDNLWQMLRPNGKLLLVTCSVWPQESELQAAAFAARHSASRLLAPGQLLPQDNTEYDHDGLFFALFQKS